MFLNRTEPNSFWTKCKFFFKKPNQNFKKSVPHIPIDGDDDYDDDDDDIRINAKLPILIELNDSPASQLHGGPDK